MKIGLQTTGLDKVGKQLAQLTGVQFRTAAAKAINDTAYQVRRKMQEEMRSVFTAPTPFIINSVFVKQATPDNLVANIEPTYYGKKGVDPQQILRAQEAGGSRRDKKSEVILRRHGWLPAGYQTAIPANPFPGSVDAYGNLKGSFIVQMLSYLQLASEQGYFQNMKATGKANLKAYGSATKAKKTMVGPRLGRTYFIAGGQSSLQLEGGDRMVMRTTGGQRTKHLAKGIWAKLGTGRGTIKPVLMFVKTPYYAKRLSMEEVARKANTDAVLAQKLRYRIRQAVGE